MAYPSKNGTLCRDVSKDDLYKELTRLGIQSSDIDHDLFQT